MSNFRTVLAFLVGAALTWVVMIWPPSPPEPCPPLPEGCIASVNDGTTEVLVLIESSSTPPPTATEYVPEPCPTLEYRGMPDGRGVEVGLDVAIANLEWARDVLDRKLTSTEGVYDWEISSSIAYIDFALKEAIEAQEEVAGWNKYGSLTCPGRTDPWPTPEADETPPWIRCEEYRYIFERYKAETTDDIVEILDNAITGMAAAHNCYKYDLSFDTDFFNYSQNAFEMMDVFFYDPDFWTRLFDDKEQKYYELYVGSANLAIQYFEDLRLCEAGCQGGTPTPLKDYHNFPDYSYVEMSCILDRNCAACLDQTNGNFEHCLRVKEMNKGE